MKMRVLSILLVVLLLLGGCAKPSDQNTSSNDVKTITIWAWDKNFNIPIMEEAAKRYKANHPNVEIKVIDYAKDDVEKKLQTGLAAGAGKGLPDIVLVEDYNAQKFLKSYPGKFADLTGKIPHEEFAQYKVEALSVDGKTYGVPFDSGVAGFFYRTDILEQAGYKPEDLQNITWDEYIRIGKEVKEKTGKYMLAGKLFEETGLLRIMMQSAGQWYFDEDGNVTIANNKALEEAIKVLKKMNDAGIVKETNGWGEWVGAMNNGDVASVVTGVWIIGSIKAAEDQSGKWAVAPIPRLSGVDSVNASNLGGSSWFVLEDSKNKEVAIDFLKSVYAKDKDFYQKILVDRGAVGTYLPSQTGSAYTVEDKFFGGQKVFEDFSKWMKKIPSVSYGMYVYEGDQAIISVLKDILDGKMSISEGLKNAEEQLKNQIQ